MRRRDVIIGGLASAQLVASRNALGQGGAPSTRAAVVIGVNKTGNLPVLRAAVSGAKSVATWLTAEGFEVVVLVDAEKPVTADAIRRAVTAFVNRGTLEQLIVYFSGHGVAFSSSEFWLLTGAPDDLNEAVSVTECIERANRSGIANVILIADACRTSPDFDTSLLHGTVIFPRGGFIPGLALPDVDRFFATRPGSPSYELTVAANSHGIYTSTFLDAFQRPESGMAQKINGKNVITNRKLKPFLLKEVPRRLNAAGVLEAQYPDTKIESPEDVYIGRALAQASAAASAPQGVTIVDIANHQFNLSGVGTLGSLRGISPEALAQATTDSGFRAAQQSLLEAKHPESFESETGFAVNGTIVRAAWTTGEAAPEVISRGDIRTRQPSLVRIPRRNSRPETVALLFEDGSGTVVAALPGFIGTLTVDRRGVMSVTYAPSRNSSRWGEYGDAGRRIEELRALVATAAQFGAFSIEGDRASRTVTAGRLADQIRVLKGIDPTLGIYAAYAYADANLIEQARSVESFMRGDLDTDLFDVALVSDVLSGRRIEGPLNSVVPFCPMLTQGWQLLRVKDVILSENVQRARNYLQPALWTTFGPRGMEFIEQAIQAARPPTRFQ
jgi:hypothetical protein